MAIVWISTISRNHSTMTPCSCQRRTAGNSCWPCANQPTHLTQSRRHSSTKCLQHLAHGALMSFRGCHADRNIQSRISVVSREHRPPDVCKQSRPQTYRTNQRVNLAYLRIQRHTTQTECKLKLATFNIHSAKKKVDDVVESMESRDLHVLCLQETWHEDTECVPIKQLRSSGFNVI